MDALERGTIYLNARPRTCKQVYDYLIDKGYEIEEVKSAIKSLKEYKYINDEEFARMYFEYGFNKGRGIKRIKNELIAKGVNSNTIEDVIYQLEDSNSMPDEFQIALDVGKAAVGDIDLTSLEYKERKKIEGRIGRRLSSRGFSADMIYRVIRTLSE